MMKCTFAEPNYNGTTTLQSTTDILDITYISLILLL